MASNTVQSFRPLADFASAFEGAAEAQLNEAVPFTSERLLAPTSGCWGPTRAWATPAR